MPVIHLSAITRPVPKGIGACRDHSNAGHNVGAGFMTMKTVIDLHERHSDLSYGGNGVVTEAPPRPFLLYLGSAWLAVSAGGFIPEAAAIFVRWEVTKLPISSNTSTIAVRSLAGIESHAFLIPSRNERMFMNPPLVE